MWPSERYSIHSFVSLSWFSLELASSYIQMLNHLWCEIWKWNEKKNWPANRFMVYDFSFTWFFFHIKYGRDFAIFFFFLRFVVVIFKNIIRNNKTILISKKNRDLIDGIILSPIRLSRSMTALDRVYCWWLCRNIETNEVLSWIYDADDDIAGKNVIVSDHIK